MCSSDLAEAAVRALRIVVADPDVGDVTELAPAKAREVIETLPLYGADERLRSPIQAPKANAFAESFIGTIKRECLNHFMCFSRDQLDYITSTWVRHYNTERPHRGFGMNNEVLDRTFRCVPSSKLGRLEYLG